MKLLYKFLNFINCCDHKEEAKVDFKIRNVPFKTVVVTENIIECVKCGRQRSEYTYEKPKYEKT
jgi:uncharacterized protein CbrC (UPF0167 family)